MPAQRIAAHHLEPDGGSFPRARLFDPFPLRPGARLRGPHLRVLSRHLMQDASQSQGVLRPQTQRERKTEQEKPEVHRRKLTGLGWKWRALEGATQTQCLSAWASFLEAAWANTGRAATKAPARKVTRRDFMRECGFIGSNLRSAKSLKESSCFRGHTRPPDPLRPARRGPFSLELLRRVKAVVLRTTRLVAAGHEGIGGGSGACGRRTSKLEQRS